MVPFSFKITPLNSRVMKERSWPPSPPVLRSLGEGGLAKNPHEPNGNDGVSPSPIGTHYTSLWLCVSVANRPFFKNTKITKRTQFKKPLQLPSPPAAKGNLSKFIKALKLTFYEQLKNLYPRQKQPSNVKKSSLKSCKMHVKNTSKNGRFRVIFMPFRVMHWSKTAFLLSSFVNRNS